MCIDSRDINNSTIRYRFPFLRMDDLMDCLSGENFFSKIDLKRRYHKVMSGRQPLRQMKVCMSGLLFHLA